MAVPPGYPPCMRGALFSTVGARILTQCSNCASTPSSRSSFSYFILFGSCVVLSSSTHLQCSRRASCLCVLSVPSLHRSLESVIQSTELHRTRCLTPITSYCSRKPIKIPLSSLSPYIGQSSSWALHPMSANDVSDLMASLFRLIPYILRKKYSEPPVSSIILFQRGFGFPIKHYVDMNCQKLF